MGNSNSTPAPIAPVVRAAPPPPPDPVAICTANKVKANDLQNQLNQVNGQIDSCDPSVKVARQSANLTDTNRKFVEQNKAISDTLSTAIAEKFRTGNELAESVKLLKQYEKELRMENDKVVSGYTKLEHEERRYRRDFLDNEPTEGVPWHTYGFQTSDDKVMLFFWIVASISFTLVAYIGVTMFMPSSSSISHYKTTAMIVVAALFASYLLITYRG